MIDYTSEFDCVRAEGNDKNVLILRKLDKPFKRIDGKMGSYELEYRWLSQSCQTEKDQAWACVQGQEFTYWQSKEIKRALAGKSLFDCFNLF